MNTYTAFVQKMSIKSGTNSKGRKWTSYSAKLADVDGNELDPWFQFGFKAPEYKGTEVKEGDYIRIEGEVNDRGAVSVKDGSVRISKNPPARKQADTGGGNSGGGSKSGYNSDVQRADRAYHAARGTAVELIEVLLANNSLPVAAAQGKAGKAKRYNEIMAFVDKLTVQFFRDEFAEGFEDQFRVLTQVADAGDADSVVENDLPDQDVDDTDFDDDFDDDDVAGGDDGFD